MSSSQDRSQGCLPPKKREFQALKQDSFQEFKQPSPKHVRPEAKQAQYRGPSQEVTIGSMHYRNPLAQKLSFETIPEVPQVLAGIKTGDTAGLRTSLRNQYTGVDNTSSTFIHPRLPVKNVPKHSSGQQHLYSVRSQKLSYETRELWSLPPTKKHEFTGPPSSAVFHQPQKISNSSAHIPHKQEYQSYEGANGHNRLGDGYMVFAGRSVRPASQYSEKLTSVFNDSAQGDVRNGKRKAFRDVRSFPDISSKPKRAAEETQHSLPHSQDQELFNKIQTTGSSENESTPSSNTCANMYYRVPTSLQFFNNSLPSVAYPLYNHPILTVPMYSQQERHAQTVRTSCLSSVSSTDPLSRIYSPLCVHQDFSTMFPNDYQSSSAVSTYRQSTTTCSLSKTTPSTTSASQNVKSLDILPHFTKGSLIELSTGQLKKVEDMSMNDFLQCANISPEFQLSYCKVQRIRESQNLGFAQLQVVLAKYKTQELLEVLLEYPFFVCNRGWSSCCPEKTTQIYGLPCHQLTVGDICLALTPLATPHSHKVDEKWIIPSSQPREELPQEKSLDSNSLPNGAVPTLRNAQTTFTSRRRHRSAPDISNSYSEMKDL
uniref:Uncharacterized LOC114659363 n=1 Tax=Erpetoichthys calabaricus TaxID=27687 RepID=A0A8C4S4P7_ERPCA